VKFERGSCCALPTSISSKQAEATPPLLEQAVDLQQVLHIRSELVLLQTDHNLGGFVGG